MDARYEQINVIAKELATRLFTSMPEDLQNTEIDVQEVLFPSMDRTCLVKCRILGIHLVRELPSTYKSHPLHRGHELRESQGDTFSEQNACSEQESCINIIIPSYPAANE